MTGKTRVWLVKSTIRPDIEQNALSDNYMENIIKCSHPKITGKNDRQDESLTGQVHHQAGHRAKRIKWQLYGKYYKMFASKNDWSKWPIKSTIRLDIVRWLAVILSPVTSTAVTGLEFATHWSPMRPKIEHWRLNFQNWSPAGDSRFVRWLKKTTTQLLFLNLYIRKSIGYGS